MLITMKENRNRILADRVKTAVLQAAFVTSSPCTLVPTRSSTCRTSSFSSSLQVTRLSTQTRRLRPVTRQITTVMLEATTQSGSENPDTMKTVSESAKTGMKVVSQSLIMAHAWAITRGSQSALAQATGVATDPNNSGAPAASSMADAVDAITDVSKDDTLVSRVLWYTAIGLLVYVSVGSIFLSLNRFIVKRNEKESRKLIRAWLEGDPVPSNRFLDELKKFTTPGPPKDLPYEPYTKLDEGVRRKPPPPTVAGNREERRVAKREKLKEARKSENKPAKKSMKSKASKEEDKSSGNRATRRANKKL